MVGKAWWGEAGLGVGVVVGKAWWGTEGIIFFSPNFWKFFMVALDSFVTFLPNLSKFAGRGGGSVR